MGLPLHVTTQMQAAGRSCLSDRCADWAVFGRLATTCKYKQTVWLKHCSLHTAHSMVTELDTVWLKYCSQHTAHSTQHTAHSTQYGYRLDSVWLKYCSLRTAHNTQYGYRLDTVWLKCCTQHTPRLQHCMQCDYRGTHSVVKTIQTACLKCCTECN